MTLTLFAKIGLFHVESCSSSKSILLLGVVDNDLVIEHAVSLVISRSRSDVIWSFEACQSRCVIELDRSVAILFNRV